MCARRWIASIVVIVIIVCAPATNALDTSGDGAVCLLDVGITFSSDTLKSISDGMGSPDYGMTAAGASGSNSCVYTLDPDSLRATDITVTPDPDGDLWTCEAVLGFGGWSQSFTPAPPDGGAGDYIITGSWGSWTLIISDLSSFYAVAELTFQDVEDANATVCALPIGLPSGFGSLELTGVQVFQEV